MTLETQMYRFLVPVLCSIFLLAGCEVAEEPVGSDTPGGDVTLDASGDLTGEAQEDGGADFIAPLCAELDCNDQLECTTDSCDPDTGCIHELRADFCLVNGVCAADGESPSDAPCGVCSVETSQEAWTDLEEGGSCEDGDLCTTGEVCLAGTCAGGSPVTCDDGNLCTADTCEAETGTCRFDLQADYCLIDDICVTSGDYEPGSVCARCNPETSTDSFSPFEGACDDGDPCTLDDGCFEGTCMGDALDCGDALECATFSCEGGSCVIDLAEETCAIEGSCYESGESSEENPCASCQPTFDPEGWTSVKDGESCEDGDLCTAGETCTAGECAGAEPVDCEDGGECTENWCDEASGACMFTLEDNACVIESTCYGSGDANPENACQICAPAAAMIAWTDSPEGAPCGNSGTCVDKLCEGDTLSGEDCPYAIAIDPESLPAVVEGDNSAFAADYFACGTTGSHGDLAYSFAPTISGTYSFGMPDYVNGMGPSLVGITTDCATLKSDSVDPVQCLLSYDFIGNGGEEVSVSLDADTTYFVLVSSATADEVGAYSLSVSAACVPECEAGSCGSDGCGGTCGCDEGSVCVEELCCDPECDGIVCGDEAADGCGGTCGCDADGVCVEGACCAPVCDGVACGPDTGDGCGGTCGCGEGSVCLEGACCQASCDGGTCGSTADGCGGPCSCGEGLFCVLGECSEEPAGQTCDTAYIIDPADLPTTIAGDTTGYSNDYKTCGGNTGLEASDAAYSFTPEESGIYMIGMPGYVDLEGASMLGVTTDCGGNLLDSPGSPDCILGHDFYGSDGAEVPVSLEADTTYFILIDCYNISEIGPYTLSLSDLCEPICDNASCGETDGCGGVCGCGEGSTCFDGACCEPVCDGQKCGAIADDSCGGTCGCSDEQVCSEGLCCEPSCDGSTCGFGSDDGCGGSCGCSEEQICNDGLCCEPSCDAVVCGPDTDNGCGGTCGCEDSDVCLEGACCTPVCGGTTCGLTVDGCGGSCECADGLSCVAGGCYETDQGDSCQDAFEVGDLPFAYTGSTSTSSDVYSVEANACPNVLLAAGVNAGDQAFVLEAPSAGTYTVEVTSLWDAAVYVTTDCGSLGEACIGGSDSTGWSDQGAVETTTVELEAGQVVYIVVDGFDDVQQGLYELTISEPCIAVCEPGACGGGSDGCGGDCGCLENEVCVLGQCSDDLVGDTCEAPIVIQAASLPILVAGDNTPYTSDYMSCNGFSGVEEPDVVYSLTPEVAGVYSLGMPGYQNGVGPSLVGITTDCSELAPGVSSSCLFHKDYFGSAGADVDVELEAGVTYFIVIDSYAQSEIGAYNFSISAVCEPLCETGACDVSDGCGGSCGCGEGLSCFDQVCCEPVCDGSACGFGSDDGCGGSCDCGDGTTCFEGACCEPVCDGLACGASADGCGGSCGCDDGTTCFEGACCEPACDGLTCGPGASDSCGGNCGCGGGGLCVQGSCEAAPEGDQCGTAYEVVFDDTGTFAFEGDTSDANSDYGYLGGDCPGETSSWGLASKDEVFHLIPEVDGDYVISLNAEFDSNLYAVTDCSDVSGTCLAADEQMTLETITLSLLTGESAFVIVDGWSNSSDKSGTYSLTITAP